MNNKITSPDQSYHNGQAKHVKVTINPLIPSTCFVKHDKYRLTSPQIFKQPKPSKQHLSFIHTDQENKRTLASIVANEAQGR